MWFAIQHLLKKKMLMKASLQANSPIVEHASGIDGSIVYVNDFTAD